MVVGNNATALQRPCIPCVRVATGTVFSRSADLVVAGFIPAPTGHSLDLFVEFVRPSGTDVKILRYQIPAFHVVAN